MLLVLAAGCETTRSALAPAPPVNYVTPPTTYLRACPSYGDECPVVMQVYAGDRVEVLDKNDYGWGRVRLERTGAVGWLPLDLLSPSPVSVMFYVASATESLRECPEYHCRSLEELRRGDQVEKRDQNDRGWWRVRSLKSGKLGWIPVLSLSAQPGPPLYYVTITSLALRAGPSVNSRLLGNLNFNEQVEILGTSPGGWAKVKALRRNLTGWCTITYLESAPAKAPRPVPRKPKPAPKKVEPKPEPTGEPKGEPKPQPDETPPDKGAPRVM